MSDFLDWHPSSNNSEDLYSKRSKLQQIIFDDPVNGISILVKDWKFGNVSELWDDYIFDNCVRPVLDQNEVSDIKDAVRRYSILDHALFLPYVRREENPVRFRRAFWNINSYGVRIAKRLQKLNNQEKSPQSHSDISEPQKIAFVLKGPYKLAHVEFLHSFLNGCLIFSKHVKVFLILIDEAKSMPKNLHHISIVSFDNFKDPYERLIAYQQYCNEHEFDHICWVAPIQNFSLYMGMQLAPCQSYWSMKYHSIIMPSIQKYAGLGFGGNSFIYDDTYWFRGRAFPDLLMPDNEQHDLDNLKSKFSIPSNALLVGCFVRAEKLYEKQFWHSICKIITGSINVHFVIASQSIPNQMQLHLDENLGNSVNKFHHLGWVNTKKWVSNLDIYYDSYPRGSCNTIFEAIEKSVPVLMIDSSHNRESSALPYLISAMNSDNKITLMSFGVYSQEDERLSTYFKLIASEEKRIKLANKQKKIIESLKGKNYLFAKDYLNYFLGTKLTLKDVQRSS